MKTGIVKKTFKIFGKVLLGILVALAAFLIIVKVWNEIAMSREKELLIDHPGEFVEVDGHNMNIYVEGEGDHTIVFMSGWGTESPIYDFRPLYSKLSSDYKCVVIEKFGYGFSDEIDGERDFDTILRQDREALAKMGIEGPFILCAHSLSGLEADLWAQKYPEEVEAIIGLDMSSANYSGLAEIKEGFAQKSAITLNKAVRFIGINRFLMTISESDETYTDEEWKQYTALVCRNQSNDTVCRENDAIGEVCEEINVAALPAAPTLQFISTQNSNYEKWKSSHQELVDASHNGKLIELDCGHYLHQFESERIAKEMKDFIMNLIMDRYSNTMITN